MGGANIRRFHLACDRDWILGRLAED